MSCDGGTFDCIVIGSGPAGATVAKALARSGQRVLILERGRSVPVRTPLRDALAAARVAHLGGGATLVRGCAVGGTTLLYYGTAHAPPLERFDRLGLDLAPAYRELQALLPMEPLRDDLVGPAASALCRGASALGIDWKRLPKHIDQGRVARGDVGGVMKERWVAGEFIGDALARGALLLEGARGERILVRGGRACGVAYRHRGRPRQAFGANIVLAAGGVASPAILSRSLGLDLDHDRGFFCDPVVVVSGELDDLDGGAEAAMACGTHLEDGQVFLADLKLPPSLFAAGALQALRPGRIPGYRRALGIMVKAADAPGGSIASLRKAFAAADLHRLDRGAQVAEDILRAAGARKFWRSRITSAHPGGALEIGRDLDSNLQSGLPGLYVCDASVLPAPWGLPPTTTLVCLGLRLGRYLAAV